jgi:hypothetical protein
MPARPGRSCSAFWRGFWGNRRCRGLNRRQQRERFSRRSRDNGRFDRGRFSHSCRGRDDRRQARVDHDPLGPFMPRMQPDDRSIDFGTGPGCGRLRNVPLGKKQKRQQHTAGKDKISTEGHAHHHFYDQPLSADQREEAAMVPCRLQCRGIGRSGTSREKMATEDQARCAGEKGWLIRMLQALPSSGHGKSIR